MSNKLLTLELDEDKYLKFNSILEKSEKTFNQAIMMLINKTIKANSIDWLYPNIMGEMQTKTKKKAAAILLFGKRGHNFNPNTNFASKNYDAPYYWINPNVEAIEEDWFIILDDNITKRLYLFKVPKNSIKKLKIKSNKQFNVSIRYDDPSFLDIYSGVEFKKYLIDFLEYKSLV